ncbi:hypothetical protein BH10ACT1_BH10ACT1_28240 [soil metagenome]
MLPTAPVPAEPGRRSPAALAGAVAVVVAVRLWATRRATFPVIVADEFVYLSMARLLAGGHGWNLGRAATYGPVYSMLLAPWSALGFAPEVQYRAAIFTNVLIAAASFLVLEALVRRLTWLEGGWSAAVALAGTLTPSLVILAGYAWSDPLAVFAFLVLAYAAVLLVEGPSTRSAAGAAAAAVFAYAVHGRFAPAALVVLVTLGVLTWRRSLARAPALAAGAGLVVGVLAASVASGAIYGQLYEPGGQVRQTTGELGRALRLWPLLLSASGQLWYLLITTAGIAGFGLFALGRACLPTSSADRAGGTDGPLTGAGTLRGGPGAWVVAALVVVGVACSAGFMADRTRPDQLVYGRYNDAVVGLLIALGVARLAAPLPIRRRAVEAAVVAGAALATVALIRSVRGELLGQPYNGITIRSLLAYGPGGTGRTLFATAAGLVATASVVLVSVAARSRPAVIVAFVVALAALGTYRGVLPTRGERMGDSRAAEQLTELVGPQDRVAYLVGPAGQVQGFYRYPFYAPDLRLYRTELPVWEQGVPFVMAPTGLVALPAAGYVAIWTDPVARVSLWQAPG